MDRTPSFGSKQFNSDQFSTFEPAPRGLYTIGSKSIGNGRYRIKQLMKDEEESVSDEQYRVVAVESYRLIIRGMVTGKMLTFINPEWASAPARRLPRLES